MQVFVAFIRLDYFPPPALFFKHVFPLLCAPHFKIKCHSSAGAVITFNGVKTIWAKTRLAAKLGLGGVMIWEVGQDCRLEPVRRLPQDFDSCCVRLLIRLLNEQRFLLCMIS